MSETSHVFTKQLAIYIHWPFCESKCPYCDFNSHVRNSFDYEKMGNAYIKEINTLQNLFPKESKKIGSIFFGGGTPSLMPPILVNKILSTLEECWGFTEQIEISIEANPNSTDTERLLGYRNAGVNRLSLGVQALNDKDLKFLGRTHSYSDSLRALDKAAGIFPRTSIDLIYGRPKQSLYDWELELATALQLPVNHISLYQLTIEKGTPFYTDERSQKFIMPDDNVQTSMFEISNFLTENAGFKSYEVSNYARPENMCQHNLAYWLYKPYVGIGPGAHGRIPVEKDSTGRIATRMHSKPETWLEAVLSNGHGIAGQSLLTMKERASEALILGLRLKIGINKKNFKYNTGVDIEETTISYEVETMKAAGLIEESDEFFRLTSKGRPLLNSILSRIALN